MTDPTRRIDRHQAENVEDEEEVDQAAAGRDDHGHHPDTSSGVSFIDFLSVGTS